MAGTSNFHKQSQLGLDTKSFCECKQQSLRSDCTFVQSDLSLYCLHPLCMDPKESTNRGTAKICSLVWIFILHDIAQSYMGDIT